MTDFQFISKSACWSIPIYPRERLRSPVEVPPGVPQCGLFSPAVPQVLLLSLPGDGPLSPASRQLEVRQHLPQLHPARQVRRDSNVTGRERP